MSKRKSHIEQVYLRCKPQLMRLVRRYLKHPVDVEDVVQEAFIRSYQSDIKKKIEQPEHYLMRTARNLSLNHLSHSSHKLTDSIEDFERLEVLYTDDSVLEQVECSEQFAIFCEATRNLPEQCRKVFILKKVYGLSHAEISERLGISVSTTNQHLAKALSRVTEHMRSKGYLEDSKVTTSQSSNH